MQKIILKAVQRANNCAQWWMSARAVAGVLSGVFRVSRDVAPNGSRRVPGMAANMEA